MKIEKPPASPNPNAPKSIDPEIESAMAVYSDTDMDPNRDDQKDEHHGADDE